MSFFRKAARPQLISKPSVPTEAERRRALIQAIASKYLDRFPRGMAGNSYTRRFVQISQEDLLRIYNHASELRYHIDRKEHKHG